MATAPLPADCSVFLDSVKLDNVRQQSAAGTLSGLIPLSPLTIDWGVEHPWDDLTPSVLTMRFLDADGTYSANQRSMVGRRLTVRPDYSDPFPCFAMFDGFINEVSAEESKHGSIISVKASSRLLNLLRDTRQGPATGLTPLYQNKGYQWISNNFYGDVLQRTQDAGYQVNNLQFAMYGAPRNANDKISVFELLRESRTLKDSGATNYRLSLALCMFDDYRSVDVANVPGIAVTEQLDDKLLYCTGDRLLVKSGSSEYTDARDSIRVIRAKYLALPDNPELAASQQYTQLSYTYYHRSLTNSNATDAQRQTEATYWTYAKDGMRTVNVPGAVTDAPNTLSFDINWVEYDSGASNARGIDVSGALDMLREYNGRINLPELTLYGDAPVHQIHMDTSVHPIIITGSKYEESSPGTHGSWLVIGGELTYDAKRRKSPWAHKLRLFPLPPNPAAPPPPTCLDWYNWIDADVTYPAADWDFGACRYIDVMASNSIDS
jgi:hypothetical protein